MGGVSKTLISGVRARRVWDSRGRPTVEAEVTLAGGATGRAIAPAGASRGAREAVDLRDGGTRFGGFGVDRAMASANGEIANALAGLDACNQFAVDTTLIHLDGTSNKARLGGNATVAVSLAVAQAAAACAAANRCGDTWPPAKPCRCRCPKSRSSAAARTPKRALDLQDLMVMPIGAASFSDAIAMVAEIYRAAGSLMADAGKLTGVADEGGYWPAFATNEEALVTLVRAIERAGYRPGHDAALSLDVAATELGRDGRYTLAARGSHARPRAR